MFNDTLSLQAEEVEASLPVLKWGHWPSEGRGFQDSQVGDRQQYLSRCQSLKIRIQQIYFLLPFSQYNMKEKTFRDKKIKVKSGSTMVQK